jgi:hypothetical protein
MSGHYFSPSGTAIAPAGDSNISVQLPRKLSAGLDDPWLKQERPERTHLADYGTLNAIAKKNATAT